jgi:cytochrome c553
MSNAVVRLVKNRKPDRSQEDKLGENEQKALAKLQAEAKQQGATLATGGKGGLPPSLVLGVMRRDEYKCKKCGESKDLSVHHKAGTPNLVSRAMRRKGHSNDPNNLVTVCAGCHDDVHQEDRDAGKQKEKD